MKKIIISLFALNILIAGCDEACKETIHKSNVYLDVSDQKIIDKYSAEVPVLLERVTAPLQRCEGAEINIQAIGQKIGTGGINIKYPATGILHNEIGDYGLRDSNNVMPGFFAKRLNEALNTLKSVTGDSSSQIFWTLNSALKDKPTERIIIYSDLIENFKAISFYKGKISFRDALPILIKEYAMDTLADKPIFTGQISIVSSLADHQKTVLEARNFYREYFTWLGITDDHFELINSISETKFRN